MRKLLATDEETRPLKPLGQYEPPSMAAPETLRLKLSRLLEVFPSSRNGAFIGDDKLQQATLDMLDSVVAPPACGPVIADLEANIECWLGDARAPNIRIVVMAPCEENGILENWSHGRECEILVPPAPAVLLSQVDTPMPSLAGDGLLVIPRLERWFLRNRTGLVMVRRLLAALHDSERRCIIGCNSWAWHFLCKAAEIDMVLPEPVAFAPFDGPRLKAWFGDLAVAGGTDGIQFKFSESGKNVFAAIEGSESSEKNAEYFEKLAAHSLGIPWVAWHMWRRSLWSERDVMAADMTSGFDERASMETLWVGALDELILPGKHPQTALLIMHSLLIHGSMTVDDIRHTVPIVGESNLVPSLLRSGFLERSANQIRCRPAAYPAIRLSLADAGFPMDVL